MTVKEYVNDYCRRCNKCDGSEYHQYHCTDTDAVEETWEAAQEAFLDAYCKTCCNLERKKCLELDGMCKQYARLTKSIGYGGWSLQEGTDEKCCGNCKCFCFEDIDGYGNCFLDNGTCHCGDVCDSHVERND